MDLPPLLRRAIDEMMKGASRADIAEAVAELSRRYRGELRGPHVTDERSALAYLAARLPATYAAVRAGFAAVAAARPDFSPASVLDIGAGPGTALWAADDCWPAITDALLIEESPVFRKYGERLNEAAHRVQARWQTADVLDGSIDSIPRSLVTLTYVLGEIDETARTSLLDRLWRVTGDVFVIVEPGTPAGWQRILAARDHLLRAGAAIVAPCPHTHACPLKPPDWCHFSQRLARSRLHREAKRADVPWEDEKFIYLAASRRPAEHAVSRVIAPPRRGSGRVTLKLCRPDGSASEQFISRRDGGLYKEASRLAWGATLEER